MTMNKPQEHHVYFSLIIALNVFYFYCSFMAQSNYFGFNQLRHLGVYATTACLSVFSVLILFKNRILIVLDGNNTRERITLSNTFLLKRKYLLKIIIVSFSFFLFLSFKNEFINQDGIAFTGKFIKDVPNIGAHITHDEMYELFVHSRFWYYTNLLFGWSVTYSYQFLSSFGGSLFILILLSFSAILNNSSWRFFFLVISGGFMQMFFGDVENYTLVSVLILLYFYLSYLYIEKKINVIIPSIVLSLAVCFHLLAGWLFPSLMYLYIISIKRKEYSQTILSVIAIPLILLILTFFLQTFYHLTFHKIYYSHAFNFLDKTIFTRISTLDLTEYYLNIFNLLFLLFPSVLIIVPLIIYKRININSFNIFMMISTCFMLIFMFIWNAELSIYNDWNLFAPCAIPISIFYSYNFTRIKNLKYKTEIYLGILFTSMLHSYSWIISNSNNFHQLSY